MKPRALVSFPLSLAGWKFETALPVEKKFVALAVPHTSNWDGLMLILLSQSVGLTMNFMIKGDWVQGAMGVLLRHFGAIPIDRAKSNNVVQTMIDELRARDELVLVVPPEGTRGRTEYWKSGFYHIALGAGVPVIPSYLDYKRKRGGFGPSIRLTGDVQADMDKIRAFYASQGAEALYPDRFGPIRLREEGPPAP